MNEAEGAAVPPAPGWYPAEGDTLCWWDGTAWSPYYISPTPPASPKRTPPEKIALALFVSPLVLLTLGGLAVMGDPADKSRVGVAAVDENIKIVPVTCPGERYRTIELRRVVGTYSGSAVDPDIWRVEGDAAPSEVVVGQVPLGMAETVPLVEPLASDHRLALDVYTNQLKSELVFSPDEAHEGEFLGTDGPAHSIEALRSSARHNAPCGDPYGDNLQQTILMWTVGASAALPLTGGLLLLVTRKSRRKRA